MTVTCPAGRVPRSVSGRLAAWMCERFPPILGAVLLPAYLVALLYGRALVHAGTPHLRWGDLAAFAGFWAFFLMLRVIDDCRDDARDRAAHPDRALQRGVVTRRQLTLVAVLAGAVQLAVVLAADAGPGRTARWWALALGWTALAARDFFLGARITDHPVLHPLLHLPLSGLVCLWVAQVGAGDRGLPAKAYAVVALGAALSASVDLVRKLLPDGGDRSYLGVLGPRRTALAGAVAVAAQTGVLAALVLLGTGRVAGALIAVLVATIPLIAFARLAAAPAARATEARARAAGVTEARARAARGALAAAVPLQLVVAAMVLLAGAGGR